MWDDERIQQYDLLKLFPETCKGDWFWRKWTEEKHDAMRITRDERSKIWIRGGSGYWSEGDISRIVWGSEKQRKAYEASRDNQDALIL